MSNWTEQELNEALLAGIRDRRWIAILDNGNIRFIHIEHATNDQIKNALPARDVKRLLFTGEAE